MENLDHFNFESCDALRLADKKVVNVFSNFKVVENTFCGGAGVVSCRVQHNCDWPCVAWEAP